MGKKPVLVTLRVYRGKQMSYDAQGNVQNENQKVNLVHDTVEWKNFMKNITSNGYLKVDVEGVKFFEKKKNQEGFFETIFSDYDQSDLVKEEVDLAIKSQREIPMSAADKKIAELEAKINSLLKLQEEAVIEPVKADKKVIENLRVEYTELNGGKRPAPRWKEDELRAKIVELKKDKS